MRYVFRTKNGVEIYENFVIKAKVVQRKFSKTNFINIRYVYAHLIFCLQFPYG